MAAASRLASIRFKAQRISRGECQQTLVAFPTLLLVLPLVRRLTAALVEGP